MTESMNYEWINMKIEILPAMNETMNESLHKNKYAWK